jgi:hypothetical protein
MINDTTMIMDGITDSYEKACIIEYLVYLKRGMNDHATNKLPSYLEKGSTNFRYVAPK